MSLENQQKHTGLRAERFSPRYFRNIGAVMLAGWISANGVVRMAEPEYYNQFTSVNPITAAGKMHGYLTSGDQCPAIPNETRISIGNNTASAETVFELPVTAGYAGRLKTAQNIPDMVSVLNSFTQQEYGFQTDMPSESLKDAASPRRLVDFKSSPLPTGAQFIIESQQSKDGFNNYFRNGMLHVIETLGAMPRSLIDLADIKSLELLARDQAATSDKLSNEVVLGDANVYERKLQIYPSALTADRLPSVLAHELGHLLDTSECGVLEAQRDSAYQDNNTFSLMYGNKNSYGARWNTVSPYGAMSVVEDKAELYSYLLTGSLSRQELQQVSEPIRNKAELLLNRLDSHLPGISDYLLSRQDS